MDILDVPIEHFHFRIFTARMMHACMHLETRTLRDVIKRKPVEFLRVPGVGRQTLNEFSDTLERVFGIHWRYYAPHECPYCHKEST